MKNYPLFSFSGDTLDDALAAWHALSGMIDNWGKSSLTQKIADEVAERRLAAKTNGSGQLSFAVNDEAVHVIRAEAGYRPTPDRPPTPPKPVSVDTYTGDPLTWTFSKDQIVAAAQRDPVIEEMRTRRGPKGDAIKLDYYKRIAAALLGFAYDPKATWEDQLGRHIGEAVPTHEEVDAAAEEINADIAAREQPGAALQGMTAETLNEALSRSAPVLQQSPNPSSAALPSFLTANPTPAAIEAEVAAEAEEPEEAPPQVDAAELQARIRAYANTVGGGDGFFWLRKVMAAGGGQLETMPVAFMEQVLADPGAYLDKPAAE